MSTNDAPVRLRAVSAPIEPDETPALEELYRGLEWELLVHLWAEIGDRTPAHPWSHAVPPPVAMRELLPPLGPVEPALSPRFSTTVPGFEELNCEQS